MQPLRTFLLGLTLAAFRAAAPCSGGRSLRLRRRWPFIVDSVTLHCANSAV